MERKYVLPLIIAFSLIAGILIGYFIHITHEKEINLLKNSGFEEGVGDNPAYWYKAMVPAEGLNMSWVSDIKHSGSKSVCIFNTHVYNVTVSNNWAQNVYDVPIGKEIELVGWVKMENAENVAIVIQCWGKNNELLAFGTTQTTQPLSGTCNWTKCIATVTVPEGTERITVRAALTGTGKVWFDDIKLIVKK